MPGTGDDPVNWECLDCGAIVTPDQRLEMRFVARTYKAGTYGLTEDKTFPAYTLFKCPYCRGKITETPLLPRPPK